jgi:uncharacterized membrane protein
MAIYFCVLTVAGVDRYVTYRSGLDLGIFVQSIAGAAHGMQNHPERGSHFLYHFSPILYVVAPPLLLVHSPIVLIAVQALAGALTAPAIFLLARRRMNEKLASIAAIVSLLYPPLVGVTFTDFHENGFAPAAIAWLVWAVDARRFGWAAVFAILALAIKEDEAAVLLLLGLGYAAYSLYRKDRTGAIFGAGVSVAAVVALVAFVATFRALSGGSQTHPYFIDFYVGSRPEEQGLRAVLFRLSFLVEALGPLLFLPLRSPLFLLAAPGLVEVLTSRWSITYTMGQHYAGVWIAYVLVAFVFALAAIAKRDGNRAEMLAKLSVLVCSLILIFASPTHWGHFLGPWTAHDRALDRIIALVPSDASVGAVDEVYTHLSFDPNARAGYEGDLEYLVVDARYDSPTWRGRYSRQLDEHLASREYQVVARDGDVTLYRLRKRS